MLSLISDFVLLSVLWKFISKIRMSLLFGNLAPASSRYFVASVMQSV